jgi:GNAT superfamily N-acetyltransferase
VRTGPDFFAEHTLPDGTAIALRHIRPDDAPALRRAFAELSPESRFLRFFGAVTTLSDEMVSYLTNVDGKDHVALVALQASPDLKTERGVGVARFIRAPDDSEAAEVAVTVVDDMQHRGVGRVLLTTLAEAAHERGITRFRAEVLEANAPLRRLMEEVHAVPRSEKDGTILFDVPLPPRIPPQTPAT